MNANRKGFEEWLEEKEAEEDRQRRQYWEKKQAEQDSRKERDESRSHAYHTWLFTKNLIEKAQKTLPQLAKHRSQDDDAWFEVAVSIAAIDQLRQRVGAVRAASLRKTFYNWSRHNKTFQDVKIDENTSSKFSTEFLETLEDEKEFEHTEDGKKVYNIPVLGYVFPPEADESGKLPPPLDNDSKLKNALFMKKLSASWNKAHETVTSRLGDTGDKSDEQIGEKLKKMGLKRMLDWIREDEASAAKKKQEEEKNKVQESKHAHKAWVENKERFRIKLPRGEKKLKEVAQDDENQYAILNVAPDLGKHTAFVHAQSSRELEDVRKKLLEKGYVYKYNFRDTDGDFDEDKEAEFKQELEKNPVRQERLKEKSTKQEEAEEKFGKWASRKKRNEVARQCLSAMPVVTQEEIDAMRLQTEADALALLQSGGKGSSGTQDQRQLREMMDRARRQAAAARRQQVVLHPTKEHVIFWSNVARSLKTIDHTLLSDFLEWSKPLFPPGRCVSKWKSLPPTNINDASKTWPDEKRDEGLRALLTLSSKDRQSFREEKRRAMGQPPSAPLIFRDLEGETLPKRHKVRCRVKNGERSIRNFIKIHFDSLPNFSHLENLEADSGESSYSPDIPFPRLDLPKVSCTHGPAELLLRWQCPDRSNPASFFVVETCGAEGSESQKSGNWRVLLVDPPTPETQSDSEQLLDANYSECIRGLLPNTTYHYRIRAFNEYGASGYTFASFTTAPLPPPTPVTVSASPQLVSLTWTLYGEFRRNFRNLRRVFQIVYEGLKQHSKQVYISGNPFLEAVPRKQLMTAIKHDHALRSWLQEWPVSANAIRYFAWGVLQNELRRRVMSLQGCNPTHDKADFDNGLQNLPSTIFTAMEDAAWATAAEEDAFLRRYARAFSNHGDKHGGTGKETATGSVDTASSQDAAVKIANIASENVPEWVTWGEICFLFGKYAFSSSLMDTEIDLRSGPGSSTKNSPSTEDALTPVFSSKLAYKEGTVTVNGEQADRELGPVLESACCTYCLVPAPDDSSELLALCLPRQVRHFAYDSNSFRYFEQADNTLNALKRIDPVGCVSSTASHNKRSSGIRTIKDREDSSGIIDGVDIKYSLMLAIKDNYSMSNDSDYPEYEEVFVGKSVTRKLKQLDHATTYLVRVQAVNADGIASELSPPLYFTTPIKTLPPPTLSLQSPGPQRPLGTTRDVVMLTLMQACTVTLRWNRIQLTQLGKSHAAVDTEDSLMSEESMSMGMSLGGEQGENEDTARRKNAAERMGRHSIGSKMAMDTDFRSARKLQTGKLLAAWASADPPGAIGATRNSTANTKADGGLGVSLRRLWDSYDHQQEGRMSIASFCCLLRDIGCTDLLESEDILVDTIKQLRKGQSNSDRPWELSPLLEVNRTVDFDSFYEWWRERSFTDIVFEVRRSRGIRGWAVTLTEAVMRLNRILSSDVDVGSGSDAGKRDANASQLTTSTVKKHLNYTQKEHDRRHPGESMERVGGTVSAYEALAMNSCVYRGKGTTLQETSLLPNTLYFYRLRAIGHGPSAKWCPPLPVFTPPLAPSAPCVLETKARSVWLRWYVGEGGASKYVVEAAILQALPPRGADDDETNLRSLREGYTHASHNFNVPSESLNWTHVQTATSQQCIVVSLSARTVYRMRIRALNVAGVASAPSQETIVISKDSSGRTEIPSFDIMCNSPNDIVLGDTIKWSENVGSENASTYKVAAKVIGDSTAPEQWLKNSLANSQAGTLREGMLPVTSPQQRILSLEVQSASSSAPRTVTSGILLKRPIGDLLSQCKFVYRRKWEDEDQRLSYEDEFQRAFALDEALGFQVLVDDATLEGETYRTQEEPSFENEDSKFPEEEGKEQEG
eukprot:gb/GECG01008230.1/.p1 GENE.gb/GECG01008230.1/~~gb/GECG01008230.1/.p1  ORF type:complete len:1856 (+),score=268.45 gb/GECG01008230.1/:1-5568(+)